MRIFFLLGAVFVACRFNPDASGNQGGGTGTPPCQPQDDGTPVIASGTTSLVVGAVCSSSVPPQCATRVESCPGTPVNWLCSCGYLPAPDGGGPDETRPTHWQCYPSDPVPCAKDAAPE